MGTHQMVLTEAGYYVNSATNERYWKAARVGEVLRCSTGKVKQLFDEGRLEGVRDGGGGHRYCLIRSVLGYADAHGLQPGISSAYWTSGMVAKVLRCSSRNANRLFDDGRLEGIRVDGEWRQFSVSSVLKYAHEHGIGIDPTLLPNSPLAPILALDLRSETVDFLSSEFAHRMHVASDPDAAQTILQEQQPGCVVVNIHGKHASHMDLADLRFGSTELPLIGIWETLRDNMELLTKTLHEPVDHNILAMEIRRTLKEPLEAA